jgi:hypothetical protein
MKNRCSVGLISIFFSAASLGASQLVPLGTDGTTVSQMMAKVASVQAASRIQPQAVYLDKPLSNFLFQGAGSLAGSNGTFFHSDVAIANYRSISQTITVGWMAQGVDNGNAPLQFFSIPANTIVFMDDFVAATLGTSGFGAVLVFGVDALHNLDSSASLDGQSRIWTYQPNASGKVSLGLSAVDLDDEYRSVTGYALGLRQDSTAHTNVGIVNLGSIDHTWTVAAVGASQTQTFAVPVKAYSVSQVGIPAGTYGNLFLTFDPDFTGFSWSAYGVSVDNITGDSWASHVNQP